MSDEFSELSFDRDLKDALSAVDANRWTIEKIEPLCVLVTISSIKAPEDFFLHDYYGVNTLTMLHPLSSWTRKPDHITYLRLGLKCVAFVQLHSMLV